MEGSAHVALLFVTATIFLPFLPALILYWILPSKAEISGSYFHGVQVRLAGAFGGYFILVLVTGGLLKQFHHDLTSHANHFPLWKVEGTIAKSNNGPVLFRNQTDVLLEPASLHATQINEDLVAFTISVPLQLTQNGKKDHLTVDSPFDRLVIAHEGYFPRPIDLKLPGQWRVDERQRRIIFKEPIELLSKPVETETASRSR
jgi:hypothetical protein